MIAIISEKSIDVNDAEQIEAYLNTPVADDPQETALLLFAAFVAGREKQLRGEAGEATDAEIMAVRNAILAEKSGEPREPLSEERARAVGDAVKFSRVLGKAFSFVCKEKAASVGESTKNEQQIKRIFVRIRHHSRAPRRVGARRVRVASSPGSGGGGSGDPDQGGSSDPDLPSRRLRAAGHVLALPVNPRDSFIRSAFGTLWRHARASIRRALLRLLVWGWR